MTDSSRGYFVLSSPVRGCCLERGDQILLLHYCTFAPHSRRSHISNFQLPHNIRVLTFTSVSSSLLTFVVIGKQRRHCR